MFTFASFRRRHKKQQQQQQKDWLSILYSALRYSFQFPPARETYFTHPRHKSMNGPKTVSSGGDPILQQIQSPSVPFKCNSMQIQTNESISGGCCFQRGSRKSWTFLRATTERQPQGIKISSPIISMSAGTLCRIIADPIYESLFDNCIDLPLDSLRNLWPESSWGDEMGAEGQRKTRTTLLALFICCCLLTSCTWKFIASFRINICCLNLFYEFRPSRPFPLHRPVVSVQSNYFTGTIPKTFVNNCFIAN